MSKLLENLRIYNYILTFLILCATLLSILFAFFNENFFRDKKYILLYCIISIVFFFIYRFYVEKQKFKNNLSISEFNYLTLNKLLAAFGSISSLFIVLYFLIKLFILLEQVQYNSSNENSNDYLNLSAAILAVVIAVVTAYYLVAIQGTYNEARDLLSKLEGWKREVEVKLEDQKTNLANIRFSQIGSSYLYGDHILDIYRILLGGEVTRNIASKKMQEIDHIQSLLSVLYKVYGASGSIDFNYNEDYYSKIDRSLQMLKKISDEEEQKIPQEILILLKNYLSAVKDNNFNLHIEDNRNLGKKINQIDSFLKKNYD